MTKLDQLLGRVEVHIRALAVAAAQAQLAMHTGDLHAGGQTRPSDHNWSERFDSLAANLAEPALDDLERLRVALGCPRVAKEEASELETLG